MGTIDQMLFEDKGNISDSNFNAKAKKIAFKKAIRKENRDADFAELIGVSGLPKKNEAVLIKTNGCSDTGSIFTFINENEGISELFLSTWIISRDNIQRILDCADTGTSIVFVVSKRLKELKKSNYAFLVEEFGKRESIKYKVANCHAKTFSVKTKKGNYYTVTGSGNWTENPRIENYIITNCKSYFSHNKEWMEEICL